VGEAVEQETGRYAKTYVFLVTLNILWFLFTLLGCLMDRSKLNIREQSKTDEADKTMALEQSSSV
jgi:hypothetical protein